MPSSTVENYLKELYAMQLKCEGDLVPLGKLAEAVGVTAGTATIMIKRLAKNGLVNYESRTGANLTPEGERKALNVLRRHRLVELFLVEVVKLDWSEVHEEAEILEHAISDHLLQKIDDMLGNPTHDPHGDPIPAATGEIVKRRLISLADSQLGPATIARISDHSPQFLQFIDEQSLTPGSNLEIINRNDIAETITLSVNKKQFQLGINAAEKIFVLDEST
ncbi:Diphtheria toxin repressor [Poriferisphaera corsica]|uniref:Transcriptional regulator MntR n=1 Tax=Poriferisphaera corsica TaxID=2528020 RepID=A0A517YRK6_9BACT|nr:metal-dependent transcriptional regulator [Poriferisphaera corsica]QDU32859.1 Diphtheria toxin repressor [Poriferisphaera corsica]